MLSCDDRPTSMDFVIDMPPKAPLIVFFCRTANNEAIKEKMFPKF